jgi:hypothetical protein
MTEFDVPPPPRRPDRPRVAAGAGLVSALALGLLAGACSFDASGPPAGSSGGPDGGGATGDGSPAECPEVLHAELRVGGVAAPGTGEPLVTVLLGDTVELSAAGSCSRRSALRYSWEVGDDLAGTASPALDLESLTVFPRQIGQYPVTLTVSDDEESAEPITVVGIEAVGWQFVEDLDVRDLAIGAGRIWIASRDGPRFLDLADLGAGAQDVNGPASGDAIPDDLRAVHFAADTGLVWFARQPRSNAVWRLNTSTMTIALIALPPGTPETEVRDISSQGGGVSLATSDGVILSVDNQVLAEPIAVGSRTAVGTNAIGGWAGAADLVRLTDQMVFHPFGPDDNKIQGLAGDEDRVWACSDERGVARIDSSGQADVFTEASGLPSNRARAVAVDAAHDAWVATQEGAARYKRDRAAWVAMGAEQGLEDTTDLRAVAAATDGAGRIFAVAAGNGIAVLRSP